LFLGDFLLFFILLWLHALTWLAALPVCVCMLLFTYSIVSHLSNEAGHNFTDAHLYNCRVTAVSPCR